MKRELNYCEFDLSKVSDTKAGYFEPTAQPEPIENTRIIGECQECLNAIINQSFIKHYSIPVCDDCIKINTEKYSLLTKTECRVDYLLTDGELRDKSILPHWIKPNPHKQTYSNMLLYCRSQVEEYAFKKWGGEKGLDLEISKRKQDSLKRKRQKFLKNTRELRQKTMTGNLLNRVSSEEHEHVFGSITELDNGMSSHECEICHLKVEFEEF